MALSAAIVWEIRAATGSDTNGGGFKAGASGTDRSQQDAPQYAVTDAVTDGSSTITSATANFGTDVVGNVLYIAGGTAPITAGWYEIVSRTNATTIVVDRSTGLSAGTGATLNIGGALATLNKWIALHVASNTAWAKGDFTSNASIVLSQTVTPDMTNPPNRLIGYTTTRGDGGMAKLTLQTNTGLKGFQATGEGWNIANFHVDCDNLGTSRGFESSSNYTRWYNCKASNFKGFGFYASGAQIVAEFCEATAGGSGATAGFQADTQSFNAINCHAHDNPCPGFILFRLNICLDCVSESNTGASSHGFSIGHSVVFRGNVAYNNGGHGCLIASDFYVGNSIRSNIFSQNAGYGLIAQNPVFPANAMMDGNAYYSNTSGARSNIDGTTGIYAINPYTNVYDVTLSGDPFVDAANGDFRLNNTAGAGAACRAAGFPKSVPGRAALGYRDMGALQHQDSGGGGLLLGGGMSGGFDG
jgi:hypothetical protein